MKSRRQVYEDLVAVGGGILAAPSYSIWRQPAAADIDDHCRCKTEEVSVPADRVVWAHRLDHGHGASDYNELDAFWEGKISRAQAASHIARFVR